MTLWDRLHRRRDLRIAQAAYTVAAEQMETTEGPLPPLPEGLGIRERIAVAGWLRGCGAGDDW